MARPRPLRALARVQPEISPKITREPRRVPWREDSEPCSHDHPYIFSYKIFAHTDYDLAEDRFFANVPTIVFAGCEQEALRKAMDAAPLRWYYVASIEEQI